MLLGYSKIKKNIIISGEDIRALSENEMLKLKSFLTDNFVNHQIIPILFIRSPYSRKCSGLQQQIKSGRYINLHQPLLFNFIEGIEK